MVVLRKENQGYCLRYSAELICLVKYVMSILDDNIFVTPLFS
jgi:hypothetical protein